MRERQRESLPHYIMLTCIHYSIIWRMRRRGSAGECVHLQKQCLSVAIILRYVI